MKVFINSNNEIKDVEFTKDASLTPIEVPDESFVGWSVAKICCHKLILHEGEYAGFTPYVDSRIIEHIDNLGKANEQNASDVVDTQIAVAETFEKAMDTETDVTDIEIAIIEIYELLLGGM